MGGKKRGEVKGSMEEFEGSRSRMLTTGGWVAIGNQRFENGGSLMSRHAGIEVTQEARVDALPSRHPFSHLIRQAFLSRILSRILSCTQLTVKKNHSYLFQLDY